MGLGIWQRFVNGVQTKECKDDISWFQTDLPEMETYLDRYCSKELQVAMDRYEPAEEIGIKDGRGRESLSLKIHPTCKHRKINSNLNNFTTLVNTPCAW